MEGFKYKGYRYDHQEYEDCIVSFALFLFDKDEDGEEYYIESPGYSNAFRDYYCLAEDTPKVDEAIRNGMDIDEAFYTIYRSELSHIED